jgi:hypothetical protein
MAYAVSLTPSANSAFCSVSRMVNPYLPHLYVADPKPDRDHR